MNLRKRTALLLSLCLALSPFLSAEDWIEAPDMPLDGAQMAPAPASDVVTPLIDTGAVSSGALDAAGASGPALQTLSGQFAKGQTMTVTGSNFGTKSPAAPLVWADFENGLNPSTLGQIHAWSDVGNMAWSTEGMNGTKGVKATDGNGKWTLRVDYNYWTKENQKFYVFRHEKKNFSVTSDTQNWKVWRMWPKGGVGYPNVYYAQHNQRLYVENTGTGFWSSKNDAVNTWTAVEVIAKASSGLNKSDGIISFRVDNRQIGATSNLVMRSSAYPTYMSCNYAVHGVNANTNRWKPAWSSSNRLWADDVYVDTTWSRVIIGDSASYAACHKLEIQIPTAWSAGSISFVANPGAFSSGARAYLYVFDGNGNSNSVGVPVTVGTSYNGFRFSEIANAAPGRTNAPKNVFDPAKGERVAIEKLAQTSHVEARILDIRGRLVKSIDADGGAGESITWDGHNDSGDVVASGVYLVAKKIDGQPEALEKVVVLK